MERNLDRRVEAVVPVQAPQLQARLAEVIDTQLADDTLAWALHSDGTWHKVGTKLRVNAQERLAALAIERAHQLENENLLA
jgi:polyphosphate kinase